MPTYEYKCLDCGKTFDVFQNMTAPRLTQCRFCGGRVKRLVGAGAGIIFKGSGFYCTDYKNNNGNGGTRRSEPEAKTDKPEAKPAGAAVKPESKSSKTEPSSASANAKP